MICCAVIIIAPRKNLYLFQSSYFCKKKKRTRFILTAINRFYVGTQVTTIVSPIKTILLRQIMKNIFNKLTVFPLQGTNCHSKILFQNETSYITQALKDCFALPFLMIIFWCYLPEVLNWHNCFLGFFLPTRFLELYRYLTYRLSWIKHLRPQITEAT